jgi:hypothetical protein
MDAEQIILDYLRGTCSYWDFIHAREKNDEIDLYLADLFREKIIRKDSYCMDFIRHRKTKEIIDGVKGIKYRFRSNNEPDLFAEKQQVYRHLYYAMQYRYCNIPYFEKYDKDVKVYHDAIPTYLDCNAASYFIERNIFPQLDDRWFLKQKIKFIREKLIYYFPRNGYPHWLQGADWQFTRDGYPMRYVAQKSKGTTTTYYFIDEATGEKKTVQQTKSK